jgi:hypothetical protein
VADRLPPKLNRSGLQFLGFGSFALDALRAPTALGVVQLA